MWTLGSRVLRVELGRVEELHVELLLNLPQDPNNDEPVREFIKFLLTSALLFF